MRIALLFRSFGPYHLARLRALRERNIVLPLEFYDVDGDYDWNARDQKQDENIISLAHNADAGARQYADVTQKLTEEFSRFSPDAVAIPGYSEPLALAALAVCRKLNIATVLMSDSHSLGPQRNVFREALKRRLLKLYQAALVAGRCHAEYLVQLGFPREKIVTGYDVVDNRHFSFVADQARENAAVLRRELNLPERYFFCCSRFIDVKNLLFLVDAAERYRRRARGAWDFVIAGDGPLRNQIASRIAELDLTSHIHLLGRKTYEQLPVIYGLANALVLPSIADTWGLVVNEAMAAGLPVLVSKGAGCHQDLVEEGVNGYVFDPLDIGQLEKLLLCMSTSADCEAMGNASRRIIRQWDTDRFASGLTEAASIASSSRRSKTFGLAGAIAAALSYRT